MRGVVGSPRCALPRPFTIASLAGKRIMLIVTTGGWGSHYRPRGISDPVDETLFLIQHDSLYYPTFDMVPPLMSHRTGCMGKTRFARITQALAERLGTLFTTAPIPFCRQNAGDCNIPALTLRDGIAPRKSGFATHPVQTPT